jgi:hypothetical protein
MYNNGYILIRRKNTKNQIIENRYIKIIQEVTCLEEIIRLNGKEWVLRIIEN